MSKYQQEMEQEILETNDENQYQDDIKSSMLQYYMQDYYS